MKDNGFSYEDITDDDVLAQILIWGYYVKNSKFW
jgi:hypothetical protein